MVQERDRVLSCPRNVSKYLDTYIEFDFTSIVKHGQESPQCVVCYKVLGEGSMKPSFLKWHFSSCHPELANKGAAYFKCLAVGVKRARLDQSGHVR